VGKPAPRLLGFLKRLFFGGRNVVAISKAAREERRHRQRMKIVGVLIGVVVIIIAGLGVGVLGELLAS
jgi:hypothetical protein